MLILFVYIFSTTLFSWSIDSLLKYLRTVQYSANGDTALSLNDLKKNFGKKVFVQMKCFHPLGNWVKITKKNNLNFNVFIHLKILTFEKFHMCAFMKKKLFIYKYKLCLGVCLFLCLIITHDGMLFSLF